MNVPTYSIYYLPYFFLAIPLDFRDLLRSANLARLIAAFQAALLLRPAQADALDNVADALGPPLA